MKKVITDYLDETVKKYKNKTIFAESKDKKVSYGDFSKNAKKIATNLIDRHIIKQPIAIFIDKSIEALQAMFGVLYSGNYYTVIDTTSPKNRIDMIINTLNPVLIITTDKCNDKIKELGYKVPLLNINSIDNDIDKKALERVNQKLISTDLAYVLFTSGSTGVPKGTVISHSALISYAIWFKETFNINNEIIFGNQTPFYFSMSVSDIFSTVISGATLFIIPKIHFSFPLNLIKYLNENKINTIYWVPSALSIVANLNTFDYIMPKTLENIFFAGEVMPMPSLNRWRKALPHAKYVNLYGPTETTDICTYYVVNRKFKNNETLPIGKACNNLDVILVKDDHEVRNDEIGEIFVRGAFLGDGYYNNFEKTSQAFVQNPLNKSFPEIVYKTGDLGKYNKYGEIEYLGRADFQIKHMGYRIELGEIETNFNALDGINLCACVYDTNHKQIVMFYEANNLNDTDLINWANNKLVNYMRPNKYVKLLKMPYNANGKIDRNKLKLDVEGNK